MPRRRDREGTFTVLDGMIVVAGLAVSLWAMPEGWEDAVRTGIGIVAKVRTVHVAAYRASLLLVYSTPIVAAWTLTVLMLRLRHRPSPLRRLASQPGFVACSAVALTLLLLGPYQASAASIPVQADVRFRFVRALTIKNAECGFAIASAWMVLLVGGRWRPRPELTERMGQTLGVFWIAMIPVTWLGQGL